MDSRIERELTAAAGEGIITSEQAARLGTFLANRLIAPAPAFGRAEVEPDNPLEETEMPRFVRGFHDILITIGVLILLAGIAGLTHPAVTLLAIIPLTEMLVRRQRLALPAFTLTLAFAGSVSWFLMWASEILFRPSPGRDGTVFFFFLAGYVLAFVPYYWRYRVPVALAAMITLTGGAFSLLLAGLVQDFIVRDTSRHPIVILSFLLAGAIGLLCTAVWFDLSDPERRTRRSDVAFWLHLVAAPAILHCLLGIIFFINHPELEWDVTTVASSEPMIVVAVVTVFVVFGLAMDRRAFVTASLLSLGFSLATLLQNRLSSLGSIFFISLLVLGTIVLTIGVFWPALRRIIVGLLPPALRTKLPPLR